LIWAFDALKQVGGFLFLHFASMHISVVLSRRYENSEYDECIWFTLLFNIDSIPGTIVVYFLSKFGERLILRYRVLGFLKTGYYGNPPSWCIFLAQFLIWIGLNVISKIATTLLVYVGESWLLGFHRLILSPFGPHKNFEAIMVMGVYPLFMNIAVLYFQDGLLKSKEKKVVVNDIESNS
jgi:hypothetical protein